MSFLDEIVIYDCDVVKVRLGNQNDGGYVVAFDKCDGISEVYSFGVGDDVALELDLAKRFTNIERIKLYDPTIDHLPQTHDRFAFHKYGIGKGYAQPSTLGRNNFLKMDVEGHEWEALGNMHWAILNSFSQIIIEFHFLWVMPQTAMTPYFTSLYQRWADEQNDSAFSMYCDTLRRINSFFYCFHAHANNSLPLVTVNGLTFPPLLEMSFIRKDMVSDAAPTAENFPVFGLDMPNKVDRPDIIDWYPLIRGANDVERAVQANKA